MVPMKKGPPVSIAQRQPNIARLKSVPLMLVIAPTRAKIESTMTPTPQSASAVMGSPEVDLE